MSTFNNKMRIEGFESLVQAVNALTPTTAESIGEIIYNQTAAEAAAGVTPTAYRFPPGDVRRYGADLTGVSNSATAINNSLRANEGTTFLPAGTYRVDSTILIPSNRRLIGDGAGDYRQGAAIDRITAIRPSASFVGTDIIRADPADFNTDAYAVGIGLSDLCVDMFDVRAAAKVAIRFLSVTFAENFDNLRVINQDSGQYLYLGKSANVGALECDGLDFYNFYTLSNGIDVANTDPCVVIEESYEIEFHGGKISRRSNGVPAIGSVGILVRSTSAGVVQDVVLNGLAFGGIETHVRVESGAGSGQGPRHIRAVNTRHEVYKYGFIFAGASTLPTQFNTIIGASFTSPMSGAANVYLDYCSNSTFILDEFAGDDIVFATSNSSSNVIFAQPAQVSDSGTENVVMGRSATGGALSVNKLKIGDLGLLSGYRTGSATWDPANIVNGASTSTTVTVTGAAVGNLCTAGFSNAVPAGAILSAQVTAANTVTVTLFNATGADLNLASGTVAVGVFQ